MKNLPSQLTPFVRSDAVGALLAEVLGHPDREGSLHEVSRRTGVRLPVVHREVGGLVEGDVLCSRQEGRNRLVHANRDHPLYTLTGDLIAATYGPVSVLRDAFEEVQGVEQILIYGSWAARRAGEARAYPNDIDVLVIGEAPRRVLTEITATVGEQLDIPVNITRMSRGDWDSEGPTPGTNTSSRRRHDGRGAWLSSQSVLRDSRVGRAARSTGWWRAQENWGSRCRVRAGRRPG